MARRRRSISSRRADVDALVAIISGNPGITTPAIVEASPWCDDTTRLALKAAERLRLVRRRIGLRRIEHWEAR